MIELRSDTFTRPPEAMRAAMAAADVGDDVYGEDPTVNRPERLAADLLGTEAGCLLPSGTMANLAILLAHAPRGATAIVGAESDIYLYQAHGASVVGGLGLQPVTNIVLFRLPPQWTVDGFVAAAGSAGVALGGFGHGRVRAVTHADVSAGDVDAAVEILGKVLDGSPA